MTKLASCCALAFALSAASVADAAPSKGRVRAGSSKVFQGKPTPQRGTLSADDGAVASATARAAAASDIVGSNVVMPEALWASVGPRAAKDGERAALVFVGADAVDGKRNVAAWTVSTGSSPPGVPQWVVEMFCAGAGCPGSVETGSSVGMQLWVKAQSSKRYYAECRVRFEGKKGNVRVTSDGGYDATFAIDYTGKSVGRVGFVIDPEASGWYGFSLSADISWTSSGCTVDQID